MTSPSTYRPGTMPPPLLGGARINEAIAYRKIGDNYVIVMTDDGRMAFLNETAGEIVEMLDEGLPEVDVPDELSRRYGVNKETTHKDFIALRNTLFNLGLILPIDETIPHVPYSDSINAEVPESDLRDEIKAYCVSKSIPLQAFIEVTRICNLNCTHCYLPPSDSSRTLEKNLVHDVLGQLREVGCLEVVFTGGEPLVSAQMLAHIRRARDLKFSVVVKTNAMLLDQEMVAAFRQLRVTEVQSSLYSMDPSIHDSITGQPGSHASTVDALRRCAAAGQRCRLSCVVMRSNYQHLDGLKEFAQEIGAPIGFDLVVTKCHDGSTASLDERLTPDELQWLDANGTMGNVIFEGSSQIRPPDESAYGLSEYPIEDPNSPVCGAACTLIAIDATGEVRPCIAFPFPLGNVGEKPIADILSITNDRAGRIRSLTNASFEECEGCDLVASCPRCMATIYQETGSFTQKSEAICKIAVYHQRYGG